MSLDIETENKTGRKSKIKKYFILSAWIILLIVCFINRSRLSVDGIIEILPESRLLTVLIIWALFAFKSFTVVIYAGILYTAVGMLFPTVVALPISIVGTAIMITIPFFIGRHYGKAEVDRLMSRYPKLEAINNMRSGNDFILSFLVRIVAVLPSDPVSIYLGATNTKYRSYMLGSLLGMFHEMLTITVMGTSINNVQSPVFMWALIAEVAITGTSIFAYAVYKKHKRRKAQSEQFGR